MMINNMVFRIASATTYDHNNLKSFSATDIALSAISTCILCPHSVPHPNLTVKNMNQVLLQLEERMCFFLLGRYFCLAGGLPSFMESYDTSNRSDDS